MKNILNITIIEELLFIIKFRKADNEEDIKKLAYSARLVAMFILFSLICLIAILIAKYKFYYPIDIAIVILVASFVVIPAGILFINRSRIDFVIQKYEFEKRQKQEQEEAPVLRITLKEGEVVTGKFFIERGNWLRSVETNISYNENYIVKIERL
ncbi:hypothetical protein [Capnocytophaga sputigena]|jgi:hypothetical protein|uniref:hypothetical protein n=1 Tax=Capnocytophaga sputigena TaxID=1019 RepID=UPI0028D0C081|nr:hypothetical protein [Capnocytophaga sputigena]